MFNKQNTNKEAVEENRVDYELDTIGKKGIFLQEMVKAKVLVPPAFVVVSVFDRFMKEARLNSKIKTIYNRLLRKLIIPTQNYEFQQLN